MSSQERQDYQFYEQNQKEEIPQILNQKQGKKNYYKNIQRGNGNSTLEEKQNNSSMNDYNNK